MHVLGAHVSKPVHPAVEMCTRGAGCTLNFEHCGILVKQKVGRGLRGSGPHSKRIPRKLTCWILRYDIMVENSKRFFLNFPIIFSVFIIHSFYVSHSGLTKMTKYFSFC